MSITAWFLGAGALLAAVLCALAAVPGRDRSRRPLPMPSAVPEWASDVTGTGRVAMRKEGRHHADDLDGHTVDMSHRMAQVYRDPR